MLKTALCVTGGAVAGAGLVYLITRKTGTFGDTPPIPPEAMATYVRQIRRYAFASSQDQSPIVGLTHASYALILLETAEEIVGRDKIRASGVDVTKLRQFIAKLQDKHAEALKKCDVHLQQVLAIERGEGLPELPGHVVAGAPTGA